MKNQKPYHIEARELGVMNFREIRYGDWGGAYEAQALRVVWDYRAAGLKIDAARGYVSRWRSTSHHHYHRGEKQIETRLAGRILCLAEYAAYRLGKYHEGLAGIMALPDAASRLKTCPRVRWEVGARSIVTVRHNDVTWSDRRSYHYPTSSTVSYTSHLIRTDEPGTLEAYNSNEHQPLETATERKTSHSLRGNWQSDVVRTLLGIDYEQPAEIFYKKVAFCPAFSLLASVFDGSAYHLGESRRDLALKNHHGGLYCYRTAEEAQEAPFPDRSVLIDAQKCILAVQVRGRKIRYEGGKYAVTEMTPIGIN